HPLGQRLQQRGLERPHGDPDQSEYEADGAERERDRVTDQQHHHQPGEHHRGQHLEGHQTGSFKLKAVAGMRPRRNATRLMISETPWRASSEKATGISSLTGQRISPPGSEEYSFTWIEFTSEGQLYQA